MRNLSCRFGSLLQYRDTAVLLARSTVDVAVVDDVVVDVVVVDLPATGAVPLEVFAGGGIDELAPAVVDVDLEVFVLDLIQRPFRNVEIVIQAVAIRRESIRQQQRMLARLDGELGLQNALPLGGGDRVDARLVHDDGSRGLSSAPEIVGQAALDFQHGRLFFTEVAGVRDDLDGGVHIDQMQRVHLFASVLVVMREGVGASHRIGDAIPNIISTYIDGCGGVRREVDGEVQRVHLGAPMLVGMTVQVGAGVCIGGAVPRESLAGDLCVGRMDWMIDGEVQRVHLLTAMRVEVTVVVGAGFRIGGAVALGPGVTFTLGDGDGGVHRVVDGQMQGVYLCAPERIYVRVSVLTRFGVSGAVPGEGLTFGVSLRLMVWMTDGKVQRVHLGAPMFVGMRVSVLTRLGVGGAVPRESLAGDLCVGRMDWMIDGEMQGDDGVGALYGLEILVIVS